MANYRAYFVGEDGHFFKAVVLNCPNDEAAITACLALGGDCDIELWLERRMVKYIHRNELKG